MMERYMKLLFHCCCAPCISTCITALRCEEIDCDLFWYNPNIHPYSEYKARLETLCEYTDKENLKLEKIEEYGLQEFMNEVHPEANRCEKCYRIRLEKTAYIAAHNGYSSFSTSLLVSPYQDHDTICCIGRELADKYSVEFFYRDFRHFFREGQAAARKSGIYMQKYCGCTFSASTS